MQTSIVVILAILAIVVPTASGTKAEGANPLAKVISLLDGLAAKITSDGEAEEKAFHEFFEWCDDTAQNTANAIKTGTMQKGKLEAKINEHTANIETATSEIEELVGAIANSEEQLTGATTTRKTEAADFADAEKQLVKTVDTLDRATGMLTRQMEKGGAALAQIDTTVMNRLLESLSVVIDAAGFSNDDTAKLAALLQTDDADGETGAPAADNYKSKSGSIIEVLEDMKEKAETQLSNLREAETKSAHNYKMLKQSLEAQIAADTKDKAEQTSNKAADEEGKATAEGNLEGTVKDLKAAKAQLAEAKADCMTTAADHEATVASRKEELATVAKAKKILVETTGGAVDETYSLLQLQSTTSLKNSAVVSLVSRLAKKHHSVGLAQLASRISAVMQFGGSGDIFAKVKGLIQDMISKLQKEGEAEASEKAYCDEEMGKTEAKKEELEDDNSKLTAKIDQAASSSGSLKEEVKVLQAELATISKQQAELDGIRKEQHADYVASKSDLVTGLGGVRKALGVLQDYYSSKDGDAALLQDDDDKFGAFMQQPAPPQKHEASGGAGASIIGILQVCESDFATNLAKVEAEEADSQSEYEKITQENKISTATKEGDVKYKSQEAAANDKSISELSGDRETANTELSAVNEYYSQIKDRCVAKPESYEERTARRTAEINGLKQALEVLEGDSAFTQRKHRSFRGRRHQ